MQKSNLAKFSKFPKKTDILQFHYFLKVYHSLSCYDDLNNVGIYYFQILNFLHLMKVLAILNPETMLINFLIFRNGNKRKMFM